MKKREYRIGQSFRRVLGWATEHPNVSQTAGDGPSAFGNQVVALQGVADRLSDNAAMQKSQLGQSTLLASDEMSLRRELRQHHIGSVVQVARTLRDTVPGIGLLVMPAPSLQVEPLLTFADGFATTASIYQQVLVEHGLPEDFVQGLTDAIAAVRQSVNARGTARGHRVGATKGIRDDIALGRQLVQRMDVTVTRVLRSDPVALAEWRHAKRVTLETSAGGSSSGNAQAEMVPSATTPAPATLAV